MNTTPLEPHIRQLLTRLEAVWNDFPDEELGDTLSREYLYGALVAGFIDPQPDFALPTDFSMDDPAANAAIHAALSEFLPKANAEAKAAGLVTPAERVAAFFDTDIEGAEGSDVSSFFGWVTAEDWEQQHGQR